MNRESIFSFHGLPIVPDANVPPGQIKIITTDPPFRFNTAAAPKSEGAAMAVICAVLLDRFPQVEVQRHPVDGVVFMVRETHGAGTWHAEPVKEITLRNLRDPREFARVIKAALERTIYSRYVGSL